MDEVKVTTQESEAKTNNAKKKSFGFVAIVAIILIGYLIFSGGNSTQKDLCSYVKENGEEFHSGYYLGDMDSFAVMYFEKEDIVKLGSVDNGTYVFLDLADVSEEYNYNLKTEIVNLEIKGSGKISAAEFSDKYKTEFDECSLDAEHNKLKKMYEGVAMSRIDKMLNEANELIADSGITMKDFGFTNY